MVVMRNSATESDRGHRVCRAHSLADLINARESGERKCKSERQQALWHFPSVYRTNASLFGHFNPRENTERVPARLM